ncbi:MAG: sec-independent protein translocase protein TatA [Maribacter sp.]|jgi:sec-independent protein translocase protein TatA
MTSNILFAFGPYEIIAVLLLALLLFGGKKIPELARGLGKGIREFNSAKASIEDEIKEGIKAEDKKAVK